jgi:hypothetical protein
LEISEDHSGFDHGRLAIYAFDVVQLVSSENNPAERDAPANRSRARTRNRNRNSILVGPRECFRDIVDALR